MLAGGMILAIALTAGEPGRLTVNVADPGVTPVYSNVPLVAPWGIVTSVGTTVAIDGFELCSVATKPPCGAGALSVRLPVAETPAAGAIDGRDRVTELVRLNALLVTEESPLEETASV
jgi:hypothetical protein